MSIGVYLRVSTDYQSVEHQRESLKKYIEAKDYVDCKWYEDHGISGRTTERDGFQQLLQDVEEGIIKSVITFEVSRFSRNFMVTMNFFDYLEQKGVTVETPKDGVIKFKTPYEKVMLSFQAAGNEQWSIDHGARVKSGMKKSAAVGNKMGRKIGSKDSYKRKNVRTKMETFINEIIELHKKGHSTVQLAKKFKTSQSTISRIVRREKRV